MAEKAEQEPGIQYVDVNGLDYLAESMNALAKSVQCYVTNAERGENSVALFTGSEASGYVPVRLVLEGEAVESIADSLKRIADALTEKQAADEG